MADGGSVARPAPARAVAERIARGVISCIREILRVAREESIKETKSDPIDEIPAVARRNIASTEQIARVDAMEIHCVDVVTDRITIIGLIDNQSRRLCNLLNQLDARPNEFCSSKQSLVDPVDFFFSVRVARVVYCSSRTVTRTIVTFSPFLLPPSFSFFFFSWCR